MPHTRVNEQHLLHKQGVGLLWHQQRGRPLWRARVHHLHPSTLVHPRKHRIHIWGKSRILCNQMELKGLFTRKKFIIQTTFCGKVGLKLFLLCLSQIPNHTSPQKDAHYITPRQSRLSRGPLSLQVGALGNKVKSRKILFWATWTPQTNISYTTPIQNMAWTLPIDLKGFVPLELRYKSVKVDKISFKASTWV